MRICRFLCLMLCLVLPLLPARAELQFPADTPAQQLLSDYLRQVNDLLTQQGQPVMSKVFTCLSGFAVVGIPSSEDEEIPGDVEMTFLLYTESLNQLVLRCTDPDQFGAVAAACIQEANPEMAWQEAQQVVQPIVQQVRSNATSSFEDAVIEQNGTSVRVYFAYYPNQFMDGNDWLQMTLIFPLVGYSGGAVTASTPSVGMLEEEEATDEDAYSGYLHYDSYIHLETMPVVTPEPDSPAGEELNWH